MTIIEKLGIEQLGSFTIDKFGDELFCFASLVREIEQQRNEMLEALITRAIHLERNGADEMTITDEIEHTHLSGIIEEATDKSWDEVKELL